MFAVTAIMLYNIKKRVHRAGYEDIEEESL